MYIHTYTYLHIYLHNRNNTYSYVYTSYFMQYKYIRDIPWIRTHIETMFQQLQVTHCSNSSHQLSMRFILTFCCAVQEIKVLSTLSLSSIGHDSSAIEISHARVKYSSPSSHVVLFWLRLLI